jgi:hypothetical protein
MNGTQLIRRSASMVLASSFLFVAACGVELNGLFEGDADVDGAIPRDAGRDGGSSDRAADTALDIAVDASSSDTSSADRNATDRSGDDRGGGDGALEPPIDGNSGGDATRDSGIDSDGPDAMVGVDAADARVDSDGPRDAGTEPVQDVTAEDATADPKVDTAIDVAIDVGADARADTPADVADAGPPGTCTGACNTFDNISQTITRTIDQGSPPTMTGGTLVDGTYVVTSIVHYNGDNAPYTLAETSVIGGGIDAWVASTNGQAPVRYTTTFSTVNNQLVFAFCCPAAGNLTILYTTDGTTISHVDPANPNRIIVYTRQ